MSLRVLVSFLVLLITITVVLAGVCAAQASQRFQIGALYKDTPTGQSQLEGIKAAVSRRQKDLKDLVELVPLPYADEVGGIEKLLDGRGFNLSLGPTDSGVAAIVQKCKAE